MDQAAAKLAVSELLLKRNDMANGRWFVHLFASKLRYNRDRKTWYVWDESAGARTGGPTLTSLQRPPLMSCFQQAPTPLSKMSAALSLLSMRSVWHGQSR